MWPVTNRVTSRKVNMLEEKKIFWFAAIKSDEIGTIIDDIQKTLVIKGVSNKQSECDIAFKCIVYVNQLAYRANKANAQCKSSTDSVFQLSSHCCAVVATTWQCNAESFLHSLYHIVKYLILQRSIEYAMKLAQYMFNLKDIYKERKMTESLSFAFKNFLPILCNIMYDDDIIMDKELNKRGPIAVQVWHFVLKVLHYEEPIEVLKPLNAILKFSMKYEKFEKINVRAVHMECLQSLRSLVDSNTAIEDWQVALPVFLNALSYMSTLSNDSISQLIDLVEIVRISNWTQSEQQSDALILCLSFFKVGSFLFDDARAIQYLTVSAGILDKWAKLSSLSDICALLYSSVCFNMCRMCLRLFGDNEHFQVSLSTNTLQLILRCLLLASSLNQQVKPPTNHSSNSSERDTTILLEMFHKVVVITLKLVEQQADNLEASYEATITALNEVFSSSHRIPEGSKLSGVAYIIQTILYTSAKLSVAYRTVGLHEYAASVSRKCCEYYLNPPVNLLPPPKQSYESNFLACLAGSYTELGFIDKAMTALVGWVASFPCQTDMVVKILTSLKHNCLIKNRTEGLDKTFLHAFLDTGNESLLSFEPVEKWKLDMETLLLKELESYYRLRSLRYTIEKQPVLAAYRALSQTSKQPLLLARGLHLAMDVASGHSVFLKQSNAFLESSHDLIRDLMCQKSMSSEDKFTTKCCLGNLMYQQVRCTLRAARNRSEIELLQLDITPSQPQSEVERGFEVNLDTCNVLQAYTFLSLEKQSHIVSKLVLAMKCWNKALQIGLSPNFSMECTLNFMMATAWLFRLYCILDREVEAWELLYKMSSAAQQASTLIIAVSRLLELGRDVDAAWLAEAARSVDSSACTPELRYMYTMCSARNHLLNNKVNAAGTLINSVDSGAKDIHLVFIELILIQSEYLSYPEVKISLRDKELPETSVSALLMVYSYLISYIKKLSWYDFCALCHMQCLVMDTAVRLGLIYCSLFQPRQARCYLKNELILAQKLALPLRTCSMLSLLARVDVMCYNIADCQVKLEGLRRILELSEAAIVRRDCASPVLSCPLPQLPTASSLAHPPHCACEHCTNTVMQCLVLESSMLRSQHYQLQGQTALAVLHFQEGLMLARELKARKKLMGDMMLCVANLHQRIADYHFSVGQCSKALQFNKSAYKALSSYDTRSTFHLIKTITHQQILDQKACILKRKHDASVQSKSSTMLLPLPQTTTPMKQDNKACYKTPAVHSVAVKQLKSTVPVGTSSVTPFARPIRSLRFDDSDDEQELNKENLFQSPKTVRSTKKKLLSPPLIVTQTPGLVLKPRRPISVYCTKSPNNMNTGLMNSNKSTPEHVLQGSKYITKKIHNQTDQKCKTTEAKPVSRIRASSRALVNVQGPLTLPDSDCSVILDTPPKKRKPKKNIPNDSENSPLPTRLKTDRGISNAVPSRRREPSRPSQQEKGLKSNSLLSEALKLETQTGQSSSDPDETIHVTRRAKQSSNVIRDSICVSGTKDILTQASGKSGSVPSKKTDVSKSVKKKRNPFIL